MKEIKINLNKPYEEQLNLTSDMINYLFELANTMENDDKVIDARGIRTIALNWTKELFRRA